mmetsp:Transcript_75643/g.67857  ORF Transcript_75643/g.67857 Transcript_75643/m.67857 type:complete len:127 (+) Transcript_75643:29-409(+)|eukprot:CAMPEP_0201586996 /NCGR_PEP_ID=MMETSP0190_2-20130828/138793_1 /ASSEMBLY_ACC=CAM_ASM_000263 /TAXON_ID=37353 /ORGANISM="Rosalina sp." /LENGTH=126 /DNA_ID=CAMNT_0048036105 /DNA_START=10 /DNA_END=390 /DNA_ORIENTATION=-
MADAITQLQQHLVEISFDMAKCIGTIFHESGELKAENGQVKDFDPSKSQELAQNIIKKIMQNDILISSLPQSFSTEEEQLQQIQELLKKNEEIDKELIEAKEKAKDVQSQISNRLLNLSNNIYGIK